MSDTTSEAGLLQADTRDERGRFVRGVSGNPGGKPAGSVSLKRLVVSLLELPPSGDEYRWPKGASTFAEAIVLNLLSDAVSGDAAARKLVFDYAIGRPTQSVEIATFGPAILDADSPELAYWQSVGWHGVIDDIPRTNPEPE